MPLKLGTSNEAPQGTLDRTQGSLATRYRVVDTRPYQLLKLIFGRRPDAGSRNRIEPNFVSRSFID